MAVGQRKRPLAGEVTIDARGFHYRELNEEIRRTAERGARTIKVINVNGQRYIGAGLGPGVRLILHGTPGNDLGAFMDGAEVEVFGNAQDGVGNTMNGGRIVVHGHAGQIAGLSMRGGRLYIRGSAGYRSGIHMKGYENQVPVVVIGGRAGAFLAEYMAGGRLYVLGLEDPPCPPGERSNGPFRLPSRCRSLTGIYTGTGMHGGVVYVRGEVPRHLLGKEVTVSAPDAEDLRVMEEDLSDYASCFGLEVRAILGAPFIKITPRSHRPYGRFYAY